jgi:uncharacterized cupredoxin-like copper-binding protein
MRKFISAIAVGAAALTLVITACGGGSSAPAAGGGAGASGGAASATTLKMQDIKFDKTALKASKGQALTITFTNEGALDHDFTIDKIEGKATIDGKDAAQKDAQGNAHAVYAPVKAKGTGKLELTASAAGSYEFYCTVPGHKDAGMKGTLTVS